MQQYRPYIDFSVIFALFSSLFEFFGLWWAWMKFFRYGPNSKIVSLIHIRKCGKFQLNCTPVVVQFSSELAKKLVFRNCHKLKHYTQKVSIWDDLPLKQRQIRKTAVQVVKKAK